MGADAKTDTLMESLHRRADEMEERCTFEAFQRSQALYAPLGGALVVLSFALLHFGALVPFNFGSDGQVIGQLLDGLVKLLSKELIETDYAQTHVFAMLMFVIVLCCGLYCIHYANDQKDKFRATHPYISEETDKDALAKAGKTARRMMVVAAVFGVGGVIVFAISRTLSPSTDLHGVSSIFDSAASPLCNVLDGCSFLLFAAAIWFLMRAIRIGQAPSRLAYNLEVLTDMTPYEVVEDHASPHYEARLAAKQILDRGIVQGRVFLAACAILSFLMFVLPSIELPIWWLPLVIGLVGRDAFVACAVKRCDRELSPLLQ